MKAGHSQTPPAQRGRRAATPEKYCSWHTEAPAPVFTHFRMRKKAARRQCRAAPDRITDTLYSLPLRAATGRSAHLGGLPNLGSGTSTPRSSSSSTRRSRSEPRISSARARRRKALSESPRTPRSSCERCISASPARPASWLCVWPRSRRAFLTTFASAHFKSWIFSMHTGLPDFLTRK